MNAYIFARFELIMYSRQIIIHTQSLLITDCVAPRDLSYYCDMTPSQELQLSMKAAVPLVEMFATASCRCSKTGPGNIKPHIIIDVIPVAYIAHLRSINTVTRFNFHEPHIRLRAWDALSNLCLGRRKCIPNPTILHGQVFANIMYVIIYPASILVQIFGTWQMRPVIWSWATEPLVSTTV